MPELKVSAHLSKQTEWAPPVISGKGGTPVPDNPRQALHLNLHLPTFLCNCLVVWEIMCIFASSKKSFCRKTTDIWTTAKGAKLLVLMGLRLRRRRVSHGLQALTIGLRIERKTVFRVGKRGGYLDTKGRSFCLSVVKFSRIARKIGQKTNF